MSKTILSSQPAAPYAFDTSEIALPELDVNIRSISLIRNGRIVRHRKRTSYHPEYIDWSIQSTENSETQDVLLITDLLNDFWYLLTPRTSGYQLTFSLKEGQVIVDVQSSSNPADVAQKVAEQLVTSGAHFQ